MSKLDKVFKSLEKYQGKPTKISIDLGEGVIDELNIYPLPNKYLPILLQAQELAKDESRKNEAIKLNQELINASLAFSLCVDKGEMSYQEVTELPEIELERVVKAIGNIPANNYQKLMEGIMKANEVGEKK